MTESQLPEHRWWHGLVAPMARNMHRQVMCGKCRRVKVNKWDRGFLIGKEWIDPR